MENKMKNLVVYIFVTMIGYCVACTKDKEADLQYGSINGTISTTNGGQGFTVTLADSSGGQALQVMVTEETGSFTFKNVLAGKYQINAQKEDYIWKWMWIDDIWVNNSHEINVVGNTTTDVNIYMESVSHGLSGELTITDINGNPINDRLTIPKYTTTIALKLFNETAKDISWYIDYRLCFLKGARDTVVGSYSGYTGFDMYYIFSDMMPSSGTLSPGENTLVVGTINQNIYALDRFSSKSTTLSIKAYINNILPYSKDIELDLPFVNITDMSEWYDHK